MLRTATQVGVGRALVLRVAAEGAPPPLLEGVPSLEGKRAVAGKATAFGIGGGELARRLRERTPRIGVVLASGYDADKAVEDVGDLPGVVFLPKPYAGAEVARALAQVHLGARTEGT